MLTSQYITLPYQFLIGGGLCYTEQIYCFFTATSPLLLLLFLHPHIASPLPSPSVTELQHGASTSFIVLPLLTRICLCLSHSLVSFSYRRIALAAILLQC